MHNLPTLVGIGLEELPNSGDAKAPPAPPLTTALIAQELAMETARQYIRVLKGSYSGAHISWHELVLAGNQGNHQNLVPSILTYKF